MKKAIIISSICLLLVSSARSSHAQVSVSVNIGVQPDWGPIGYDYVEYYYIPQYEVYYYVPNRQFVYFEGGRWIFAAALPPRFGHVDLYTPYKVVINEPKAYRHFKEHQVKYRTYKGGGERQEIIRDSKDSKYVEARKHSDNDNSKGKVENNNTKASPEHNNTKEAGNHDNSKAAPKQSAKKGKDNKKGKPAGDNPPHDK